MTEHVTAHAFDGFVFLAGCICGWQGQRRSTFAVAVADELAHCRQDQKLLVDTSTHQQ